MPNWVYNKMTVNGSKEQLKAFAIKAGKQHETRWLSEAWVDDENGKRVRVPENERKIEVELSEAKDLSFWNFVSPPQEIIDNGEYFGTKGWVEGKEVGDTENNWYQWNLNNWGCKWDCSDVYLEIEGDYDELIYTYNTPWSIPLEAMRAMAEQHPELHFYWYCDEEQGWGGEYDKPEGETAVSTLKEWDIPQSHADYVDKDDEDGCICARDDDQDEWYDDCPRDDREFILVVQKSYRVRTNTAENAYELITENNNDPDELMEFIEGTMNLYVADTDGKRIYPTLDN